MKKVFNIFVEGLADARFFKQYISHVFGEDVADERIVTLKGWDNLKTEASAARMRYGYLEALLGESSSQKELIKEVNRNYEEALHWNLDAEYLQPLKEFLTKHLSDS